VTAFTLQRNPFQCPVIQRLGSPGRGLDQVDDRTSLYKIRVAGEDSIHTRSGDLQPFDTSGRDCRRLGKLFFDRRMLPGQNQVDDRNDEQGKHRSEAHATNDDPAKLVARFGARA